MNTKSALQQIHRLPQLSAVAASGIALLALVGWLANVRFLAGQWNSYIPMSPSTAFAFLFLGAALFGVARWHGQRLSPLFALVPVSLVFLLGLLVLTQFISGVDLGVEQVLPRTNELLGSTPLGRMSPLTATSFLLESAALFIFINAQRWRNTSAVSALLAAGAVGINAVVLLGYAYGTPLLYGGTIIPVAFPTAIAFALIGIGQIEMTIADVSALRAWRSDTTRGLLLRAFLPPMMLLLVIEGWLAATLQSFLALNFALWQALMVLLASILIVAVTAWVAEHTGKTIEQAHEALRESEERYRLIFENSGEAILFTQPDGTIYSANPEARRIFGRSENEIRKLGRAGIVDTNDPRLSVALEERKRTGKFRGELNLLRNDGTIFPGELSTTVFKDSHGNERTSMIIGDITERKRAEEALRESEQRFSILFEKSAFAAALSRLPDGVLVAVNEAFEKSFGFTRQEALGKTSLELGFNPDAEGRERLLAALKAGGSARNLEMPLRTKSGEERFFSVNIDLVDIGDQKYILNTTQDITERKRAEEKLREKILAQETLAQIAKAITAKLNLSELLDLLIQRLLMHRRGEMITISLLDESTNELINVSVQGAVRPENVRGLRLKVGEGGVGWVAQHGQPLFIPDIQQDSRWVRSGLSNAEGIVSWLGVPLLFENRVIGVMNINTRSRRDSNNEDIEFFSTLAGQVAIAVQNSRLYEQAQQELAERKQAEEELNRSREQLRALTHHLQAAREEERTIIAREIHDELGQGLTALKMDLTWLTKRLPPEANALHEKAHGMTTMITESLQLMRRIASDLRPGLLDDLGLIAAMQWQASEFTKRSEIICRLNLPHDLSLDRDRTTVIFRIFQETLTNIVRHAQAKQVEMWLEADEAEVRLTVRDDGVGITADQIDAPTSLGLIGIRERLRYFNGSVSFESRDGTLVKVRLPK